MTSQSYICRIVVIASNFQRLTKIVSLLLEPLHENNGQDDEISLINNSITIQYLPCVAQFDQYRQEKEWIPYLVNVEYHPELIIDSASDASSSADMPTSLLELANHPTSEEDSMPVISGIVIGNGIESDICTKHIQTYFHTLFALDKIATHCITPTPSYTTVAEELQAYQALSVEEKEVATQQGTMGPGKMVHLIRSVGQTRMQEWLDQVQQAEEEEEQRRQEQLAMEEQQPQQEEEEEEEHIVDPNKVRYACRICRNILFGEDDLIQHNAKAPTTDPNKNCQSYFLQQSLPWMKPNAANDKTTSNNLDNDLRETLGRLTCQKCHAKLGTWNWSGTPCSCGAWVVPAFQFPKSKVDAIPPPPVASSRTSEMTAPALTATFRLQPSFHDEENAIDDQHKSDKTTLQ